MLLTFDSLNPNFRFHSPSFRLSNSSTFNYLQHSCNLQQLNLLSITSLAPISVDHKHGVHSQYLNKRFDSFIQQVSVAHVQFNCVVYEECWLREVCRKAVFFSLLVVFEVVQPLGHDVSVKLARFQSPNLIFNMNLAI